MAALFARNADISEALPASGSIGSKLTSSTRSSWTPRLVQGLVGGALVLIGRKKQGRLLGRAASAAGFSLLASSVEGTNLKRFFDRRG